MLHVDVDGKGEPPHYEWDQLPGPVEDGILSRRSRVLSAHVKEHLAGENRQEQATRRCPGKIQNL